MIRKRQTCRLCGSKLLDIVDLGSFYLPQYLGTKYKTSNRKVPLVLSRCAVELNEDACGLAQLRHDISANLLYKRYYYESSVNESMALHLRDIAYSAIEYIKPSLNDAIVDIGCNDGTLLNHYEELGFKNTYGFDPAKNLLLKSKCSKSVLIADYFNAIGFVEKSKDKAKIITSIAMFYDLPDPREFISDIKDILHKDGVWISEQAYFPAMLKNNCFDNICTEHLEFYSFSVFEQLIEQFDLEVVNLVFNDINGGSFQVWVSHRGSRDVNDDMYNFIHDVRIEEFNMRMDEQRTYDIFKKEVDKNKKKVLDFVLKEKRQGKKIYVYGASTKGSIILQYYGLYNDLISACADRNSAKWGLKMMGTNIPIISEEQARRDNPDYFFILPWHFLEGFVKREQEFLKNGGKFIVPLPTLKII